MSKAKKGSALVYALISLTVMMIVAIATYEASLTNQRTSTDTSKSVSSIQAADTGIEMVLLMLKTAKENGLGGDTLFEQNICNGEDAGGPVYNTTLTGKTISVQFYTNAGGNPSRIAGTCASSATTINEVAFLRSSGEYGGTIRAVEVALTYDGNDQYTKLLLHFDGTNGSTLFVDSEETPKTISIGGGTPTISTAQRKFGTGSLYLDGVSSEFITIPESDDFDFGSGDFTIDWWEYRTDSSNSKSTFQRMNAAGCYNSYLAGYNTSGVLRFYSDNDFVTAGWNMASAESIGTTSINQWVHLAIVRSGNTFYAFKDGVQTDTWTSSLAYANVSGAFEIGRYCGGNYFVGYIDEFRVSKGDARWTSNFTPPSSPY